MRNIIIICLLLLGTAHALSQNPFGRSSEQIQRQKQEKFRKELNLDYSMPDYSVDTPDGNIIGWRLANMLKGLEDHYTAARYNRPLTVALGHQLGSARYQAYPIVDLKIENIQKQDSTITIRATVVSEIDEIGGMVIDKTKKKPKVVTESHSMLFTFINGLSSDDIINRLFIDIDRYENR